MRVVVKVNASVELKIQGRSTMRSWKDIQTAADAVAAARQMWKSWSMASTTSQLPVAALRSEDSGNQVRHCTVSAP